MLSENVKSTVLDENTEKYVSIVSAWEVAIKLSTKKLRLDGGLSEFFKIIDNNGFYVLPVEREYVQQLSALPDHHKDPFARLLAATAIVEGMTFITIDQNIHKYDVSFLW